MIIPRITVEKMDLELNTRLICRYVNPEFNRAYKFRAFDERTYLLYPELRGKISDGMSDDEIYRIVRPCVEQVFIQKEAEMNQKIVQLQSAFDIIQSPLMTNLINSFEMNWPEEQETIICNVGYVSSFPRNVITKSFFISYEKETDMLMMASIHEINHFVLFEKCKQMHGYDKPKEPLYPDTLWFLEEMAVDPTLNIPCIQNVASYPQRAYDQFYECMIDGFSAEQHIINIYESRVSIADFLDTAYDFIEAHKNLLLS